MTAKTRIAIGLGTNLGNRQENLKTALERLQQDVLENAETSSIYETEPWGVKDQPKFLNAVVVGDTQWEPPAIVNFLKSLEREMGRTENIKNGPRMVDLDLLIFGNRIYSCDGIEVPHPGLSSRDFVLIPLSEVWNDWIHPVLNQSVSEMLAALPHSDRTSPTK